jgi:hypothetical protein
VRPLDNPHAACLRTAHAPSASDQDEYPNRRLRCASVKALEEITYEAGQSALSDQESIVAGVRQRTGTLLAAHALVASFLGATTVKAQGLHALGWLALFGFGHQKLREENTARVRRMRCCQERWASSWC